MALLGRINDLTIWKLVTFNIFEKKNNDPFRRAGFQISNMTTFSMEKSFEDS